MISKIIKNKFTILVVGVSILTASLAVGHWFLGNKILYFWDSFIPFDMGSSLEHLFNTWNDGLFPGFPNIGWSWLLYYLLFFSTYPFFNSLSISEFTVYLFVLSFSIINFYFLAEYTLKTIFKNSPNPTLLKVSALIFGILYTFNIFTFFNFYFMFNPGAFILSFLPLNFLALIHIYPLDKNQKNRGFWILIFFVSLFAMVPGFGVYVLFLQYLIWLGLYLLYFWLINVRRVFGKSTLELVLFYTVVIFANLWWFLPAFLEMRGSYSGQSSFGTVYWFDRGFEPSKLLNVIRLLGSGLMINNKFSWSELYESNNLFTLPLFVFPLLFVSAIVFLKNKIWKFLTFLLTMTLVSLFIVKFSNPPFAFILKFAFHYIPFFGGFRDAFQKAGVFFIPGYFLFIAAGWIFIINLLHVKNRRFLLVLFLLFFILGSVILSGPFSLFFADNVKTITFPFDNKKVTISSKTQIPQEYYSLKNFIEDRCKGETIAIVPRSGFVTDGVWNKYKSGYVGQEILSGLINCNFISTAMFNEHAEYSIQAPYIHLQKGDFAGFKSYLNQTGIRYVLINNSYVPYGLITWVYLDPKHVKESLEKDKDFKKVYSNDFFSLFENDNLTKQQYGFKLTSDAIYLQSGLRSGAEYAAISKIIGEDQGVLLNSPADQEKYKSNISTRIISTDCLGCVIIKMPDSVFDRGALAIFKKKIKALINRKSIYPAEIQISLDIVDTNYLFSEIISLMEKGEYGPGLNKKVNDYFRSWNLINGSIRQNISDEFKRNTKYIEANTALTSQSTSFFKYFSSQLISENKINNIVEDKGLISVLDFQKKLLAAFSKNIIKTDSSKNTYKLRLDVPRDGDYSCKVFPINSALEINKVSIEGNALKENEYQGVSKVNLKRGSYLVDVLFNGKQMQKTNSVSQVAEEIKEVKIGRLPVGTFKVSFNLPPSLRGTVLFAITQGRREKDLFENIGKLENSKEGFIAYDVIEKHKENEEKYQLGFIVKSEVPQDYYAYFYLFDPSSFKNQINDFSIKAEVENGNIQFICRQDLKTPGNLFPISVDKDSPTRYVVQIPSQFKGFLSFNQTYNNDWVAYDKDLRKQLEHTRTGYSNTWYIDGKSGNSIIIEYRKQKASEIGAGISTGLFVLGFILYLHIRKTNK